MHTGPMPQVFVEVQLVDTRLEVRDGRGRHSLPLEVEGVTARPAGERLVAAADDQAVIQRPSSEHIGSVRPDHQLRRIRVAGRDPARLAGMSLGGKEGIALEVLDVGVAQDDVRQ